MKRPLIYLAIALSFFLAVLALERPAHGPKDDSNTSLLLPAFDSAQIFRVEYEHFLSGIQPKRDGENWQVALLKTELKNKLDKAENKTAQKSVLPEWFLAERPRVSRALGIFSELERGILVSTNPAKQQQYQLGPMAQQLRFFDQANGLIASIEIGKNGPDFASSYIRKSGEDKVYLSNGSLAGVFSISIDDWKQKADKTEDAAADKN